MKIENNIVYVKTKNGIYKCYKSEQMHKPIYYPVESKTNGFIDYNEVISILSNDDLYDELKKQQEIIDKIINYCHSEIDKCKYEQSDDEWECCIEELKGILQILEDKEV